MNATATKMDHESEPYTVSKPPIKVLLVEDDDADRELILRQLAKGKFDITSEVVQTSEEFRRRVKSNCPDVVLADFNLGQWRGLDALEILREEGLDIPLILVSGALGDGAAVECIKQGAADYVLKDRLARLPEAVRGAIEEQKLRRERRQAQADLASKVEELARSNEDLEQFAYVAAHDLQEPLRMVTAYAQLIAERYHGKLDQSADKYINYVVEGALRMQTLIRDLLAFSRLGQKVLEIVETDCNAVIEEVLQSFRVVVEQSGAVITCGSLPSVKVDRTRLVQLFQNLIGNAIKFRGEQPPRITISGEKRDNMAVFAVADNGIGVAVEDAESIFLIFRRLHTREYYDGNGVGLALCKRIVEKCGGRIWVESSLGTGATFRFSLPAESAGENDGRKHELQTRDLGDPSNNRSGTSHFRQKMTAE